MGYLPVYSQGYGILETPYTSLEAELFKMIIKNRNVILYKFLDLDMEEDIS